MHTLQAAIGWWCWIDAVIYNGTVCPTNTFQAPCEKKEVEFAYWLPGIVATFAIVLCAATDVHTPLCVPPLGPWPLALGPARAMQAEALPMRQDQLLQLQGVRERG